jgi:hypothetical protein
MFKPRQASLIPHKDSNSTCLYKYINFVFIQDDILKFMNEKICISRAFEERKANLIGRSPAVPVCVEFQ